MRIPRPSLGFLFSSLGPFIFAASLAGLVSSPSQAQYCSGAISTVSPEIHEGVTCGPNDDQEYGYPKLCLRCKDGTIGGCPTYYQWIEWAGWAQICGQSEPATAVSCSKKCFPKDCQEPESDSANYLGDPVDVTSGFLTQTVTDADLGGGLVFRRYYASGHDKRTALGYNWTHSLDWRAQRTTVGSKGTEIIVVHPPSSMPGVFMMYAGEDSFSAGDRSSGSVEDINGTGFFFTDCHSTRVEFQLWYTTTDQGHNITWLRASSITPQGERPITVTYNDPSGLATYTRGSDSIELAHDTVTGLLTTVTINDEEITFTPQNVESYPILWKVAGPDFSTPTDPSDEIEWEYAYETGLPAGRLTSVTRTAGGPPTVLGTWDYNAGARVIAADEGALDQALTLE